MQLISSNPLRNTVFAICAFLLILYPVLSFDYGITGDEWLHVKQAKRIINFYTTFGEDKTAITEPVNKKMSDYDTPNIALYGNSPDTAAYIIQQAIMPGANIYYIRHFLNALFGALGIFFTTMLAKELGGWRAAFFALGVFIVSPRFMGHTMNNLKDAPFAVAFAMSLFGMIRLLKELPRPSWKVLIFLSASLAFALSIRVGGLLLFIYLLMFLGIYFISENGYKGFTTRSGKRMLKKLSFIGLGICIAGYFAGLILWPYGLMDPLQHPLNALQRQSDFSTVVSQIFEGQRIMSENQPWYYLPKYMLITNPMIVYAGLVALIALLYPLWRKLTNKIYIAFIGFAAIFPLFYIIYGDSNVYNAWRHVLFVYPPLVALSGMGWELLYRITQHKKALKYAVFVAFAILFLYPFQWMVRNHPNQVVYYNLPFGGVEQAYGNYELDYYMNGVKPALEWMHANGYFSGEKGKDLLVAGNPGTLPRYKDMYETETTDITYMKYRNRVKEKWDYAIFYTGFVDPYQLKQRIWPPNETIYEVTVEGLPIVAVVKRPSFADNKGYQALQRGNYQKAIANFNKYLQKDPKNEVVLSLTAKAYNKKGDLQKAKNYFNKTLNVHPNSLSDLGELGRIYMQNQEFQNAISIFQQMIKVRSTYAPAYMNLGYAYAQTGNTQSAISYLEKAIQHNPRMKQAYQLLGQIYQQRGNQQQARRYLKRAKQL